MANTTQPFPPGQGLRDYTHAALTFGAGSKPGQNTYQYLPRNKFLFYVYFNLNTNIPAVANFISGGKSSVIGLMVKTAQLPGYNMEVGTMNQYNRKRLIQTKINYNPCQITFNDDNSDLIRNMWYQYYQYYYSDPQYKYGNTPNQQGTLGEISGALGGFSYSINDTYSAARVTQHWGLSGQGYSNPSLQSLASSVLTGPANSVEPFFRDITIYGMSQKTYAQYTMINPLITDWTHDTYDYSAGNQLIQHVMSIRYENVKYYSGAIGGDQPSDQLPGFADPSRYDTEISPIAAPGSNDQVMINGQLQTSVQGNKQDLQALVNTQNTLQNVVGSVNQSLIYAGAGWAYSNLTAPGSLLGLPAQLSNILTNASGVTTPLPDSPLGSQSSVPGTATYNSDGSVNATDLNGYPQGSM
jgi:hypothetical protein